MKKFFKRYAMTLVALGIAGGTLMSFEFATLSTTWHYTDDVNPGVFTDPSNWQQGPADSGICQTGGSKPCEITVEAADENELGDYLSKMTNPEVLTINPTSKRN